MHTCIFRSQNSANLPNESLQRKKFDAVYYYMRSLMASNPFFTARDSLLALFDENRKKVSAEIFASRTFVFIFLLSMNLYMDSTSKLKKSVAT